MNKLHYVYYHKDPDTNQVKYVGKGMRRRAYCLTRRGPRHLHWIRELKKKNKIPIIEIIEYFDSELEALNKEMELIKYHRNQGIRLMNITDGGDAGLSGYKNGAYGLKRTDLSDRNKSNKGKTLEEIYGIKKAKSIKKLRSFQTKGENNPMYGKKGAEAPCYGRIGDKHPMYGKQHTDETKNKITKSLIETLGKKIIRSDGKEYMCIADAARELSVKSQSISAVLKGKNKSCKGYTFQYVK